MRDAMTVIYEARERARKRREAYRGRRRHGRVSVLIEVEPHHLVDLERLSLLDAGNRDKRAIAWAVTRFLEMAPHLAATGDAPGRGRKRHGLAIECSDRLGRSSSHAETADAAPLSPARQLGPWPLIESSD